MTSDTLIIDADGDLVLSFDPEECPSSHTDDTWTDVDSSEDGYQIIDTELSNAVSRILIKATDVSPIDTSVEEFPESNDTSWVELKQVRMLVSSKHMSVASPVFKAMRQASSQEGIELKKTGKAELSLRDEDSKAWNILLDIIHGRFRSFLWISICPCSPRLHSYATSTRCMRLLTHSHQPGRCRLATILYREKTYLAGSS